MLFENLTRACFIQIALETMLLLTNSLVSLSKDSN
jgi:hypothetical protein